MRIQKEKPEIHIHIFSFVVQLLKTRKCYDDGAELGQEHRNRNSDINQQDEQQLEQKESRTWTNVILSVKSTENLFKTDKPKNEENKEKGKMIKSQKVSILLINVRFFQMPTYFLSTTQLWIILTLIIIIIGIVSSSPKIEFHSS